MVPYGDILKRPTVTLNTDNPFLLFNPRTYSSIGWRCGVPFDSGTDVVFAVIKGTDPAPTRADMLQMNQFYVVPKGVAEDGCRDSCKVYAVRVTSGVNITLAPMELFWSVQ